MFLVLFETIEVELESADKAAGLARIEKFHYEKAETPVDPTNPEL